MAASLTLYVPARVGRALAASLRGSGLNAVVRERETIETLRAEDLRCLYYRFRGQARHLRAPYAYPFLPPGRTFEWRPGADWLYLGGDREIFRDLLQARLARLGETEIDLIPYGALAGVLGRARQAGDEAFTALDEPINLNQPWWVELKDELLRLPEALWGTLGAANLIDRHALLAPYLRRYLRTPPRRILDIGCGLGQLTRSLALAFPEALVLGLDSSPEAIEVAQKTFRLPNLRFEARDINAGLNLPEASQDLIVAVNALPYAVNEAKTAHEIFRTLRPNGVLLHYSRMQESHLYWDFPASLLYPLRRQLNAGVYIQAGQARGFASALHPLLTDFGPGFFVASAIREFREGLDAVKQRLLAHKDPRYHPFHSHALMAAFPAKDQTPGRIEEESYFAALEKTL